jgi:hypothetical protein
LRFRLSSSSAFSLCASESSIPAKSRTPLVERRIADAMLTAKIAGRYAGSVFLQVP